MSAGRRSAAKAATPESKGKSNVMADRRDVDMVTRGNPALGADDGGHGCPIEHGIETFESV
jgi:hypothetical protein